MSVLLPLLQGVKEGFKGLRVLEFSTELSMNITTSTAPSAVAASTSTGNSRNITQRSAIRGGGSKQAASTRPVVMVATASSVAEDIVNAAKDRAYIGCNGLSVIVNYR